MSENEILEIANNAQMVIGGYSFTCKDNNISILNLAHPDSSMIISRNGVMLETNMKPIEQALVLRYWEKNSFLIVEDDT